MYKINQQKSKNKGFVALISVLVVTAVSIIIGTTIVMKSLTHASMSLSEVDSAQAWASANGCVENVLGQISVASTSFTTMLGYATILNLGGVPCQVSGVTASGTSLQINASSTVSEYIRKLQVVVATNTPSAIISSWREVGDF